MRLDVERIAAGTRSSALWTKGGRGRTARSERGNVRFSALWGKGGRGFAAIAALVALMVPAAGAAHGSDFKAFVPHSLLSAAEANPGKKFNVIVQGQRGRRSDEIAEEVANEGGNAKRQFRSIAGVSATLPGAVILRLAKDSHILAITPDVRVSAAQEVLSTVTTTSTSAAGPSASGGSASVSEDGSVSVSLGGSSASSCELSFALVSGPSAGSLSALADQLCAGTGPYSDSALVGYTPAPNYNGSDSFVYRVTDSAGLYADATVSISVSAVNDAPVAVDDSGTAAWGTNAVTVSVLANDRDVDGDPLRVSALMPPANGTALLNLDGTLTYTGNLGFTGVDSFTYVASDGSATSNVATVVVSIPADAEMWRQSTKVDLLWSVFNSTTGLSEPAPQAPAIAIVDSGVDASKVEAFGNRVVASVNLSSLAPAAVGDNQGHGTMVAGVAAGADPLVPGVAQNAPIVSIRTSDANGQSMTSDVIAAADWILANAQTYRIRVANFSMAGSVQTSFRFDPLNRAVERLWFSGIVVVAAAGNHGAGGPVSMSYAPANDPFIITVGALDQSQTGDPLDDRLPSWSGYGYTMDGFFKPDMAAPGRYMIMPVPANATIPATVPERILAPGYMWMSGTSFSAPVVAGAAAQLLARHPEWTADQVKGALMLSSVYLSAQTGAGVGAIDAAAAASLSTPPNPNENLYPFVETDSTTGQRYFNEANWASHVAATANWSQANWASANWASANWASANWASANWSSANWSQNVESSMTSTANWNASALAE